MGLAWNSKTDEVWFSAREAGRRGVSLEIHAVSLSGAHRVVAGGSSPADPRGDPADGRVLVRSAQWPTSMMCLPSGGVPGGESLLARLFRGEGPLGGREVDPVRRCGARGRLERDRLPAGHRWLRASQEARRRICGCALSRREVGDLFCRRFPATGSSSCPREPVRQKEFLSSRDLACNDARWFPDSKRIIVRAQPSRAIGLASTSRISKEARPAP